LIPTGPGSRNPAFVAQSFLAVFFQLKTNAIQPRMAVLPSEFLPPQSSTLASRGRLLLSYLEAPWFSPCFLQHSQEWLCHKRLSWHEIQASRHRTGQVHHSPFLAEISSHCQMRCEFNSQRRFHPRLLYPSCLCGDAPSHSHADYSKAPDSPHHEWPKRSDRPGS
jgi:hypothetical protein